MKRIVLLMLLLLTAAAGCGQSADVGIIGGADGPTAILVSTSLETIALEEMPVLEEIPAPPGTFTGGWESPENGMFCVSMADVDETEYQHYIGFTLREAGYTAVEDFSTDDRMDYARSEGERYNIEFWYAVEGESLEIIFTEKS